MARTYTIVFRNVVVSAGQDLFEIAPAVNQGVVITGLMIDQHSDVGDAQEEMLQFAIIRGHTTGGSGGTTVTPAKLDGGDAAASFVAKINNTTIASGGTPVTIQAGAFNIRTGFAMFWPPENTPLTKQHEGTVVVRLMAAPADAVNLTATLFVAEV